MTEAVQTAEATTATEPAMTLATEKAAVATLKLVVDYDHVPDGSEIQKLVDAAKGISRGQPTEARLTIHRRTVTDLPVT